MKFKLAEDQDVTYTYHDNFLESKYCFICKTINRYSWKNVRQSKHSGLTRPVRGERMTACIHYANEQEYFTSRTPNPALMFSQTDQHSFI